MAKRKTELGLGRGLNALLGDPDLPEQNEGSISLPISQVEPGLNQPRKRFEQGALDDLAESIRVHGIIQPLTVRKLSSGYYQIIAGERRWRAAGLAALSGAPTVLGAALGYCLGTLGPTALTLTLSFAAGAMLYVVVEELVPQAHSRAGTCGFVGGFLIMMVLDVALG